jgi:hypothetical protein
MASILFADHLAFLLPLPDEVQAIESVASYFERKGHATDVLREPAVLSDPQAVRQRVSSDVPDVLVTDGLSPQLAEELMGSPEHVKPGVIMLVSVTAEAGCALAISERYPHLIESYVVRPLDWSRMTPDQRTYFRVFLPFEEQLRLSVGHLLCRMGAHSSGAGR